MIRPALAILLAALLSVSARGRQSANLRASAAVQSHPLTMAQPVQRELASGESHVYRVDLRSGDFLHVTVAQEGIDIVATLTRPDGSDFVSVDANDDDFGSETVVAIADAGGVYTLIVRPVARTPPPGRYTIRLDALRVATASDRTRVEAERAFERGHALRVDGRRTRFPEALEELNKALERYRSTDDRRGEMKALIQVGIVQTEVGTGDGLASMHAAERIAAELHDDAARAVAINDAAVIHLRRGEGVDALRLLEQSESIYERLGNRKAAARSLNNEGIVYDRNGDAEQAITRFQRGLPLARATGDEATELGLLTNLANAYSHVGDFERGLEVYHLVLKHPQASKSPDLRAAVLNNIGNDEHSLGRDRDALAHHFEALTIARENGDKANVARSLHTIALIYQTLGENASALDYEQQSLAVGREVTDPALRAGSLDSIGVAWHRLGDIDKAFTAFDEALTIRRNIRAYSDEKETLAHLAALERDRGNVGVALELAGAAVEIEERLRDRVSIPALRASFGAIGQDKYELFIDLLQARHAADPAGGDEARAFEVSERARARVLLESLLDARVDLHEGIDPTLVDRERALQKQLGDASGQLTRVIARGARTEQREAAAKKVDDLTRDYETLEAVIRQQSPRYAAMVHPQPLGVRDVREMVLDEDTVLLEFAIGEERSWLWAVTPHEIRTVELPPRREIDRTARNLYEQLTARQRRPRERAELYRERVSAADADVSRAAAAVSRMLLGGIADPLENEWRTKRLAIVAAGAIEYLPFGVLPVPAPNHSSAARTPTGRGRAATRLVADHEIVTVPSASVLDVLRREQAGREPARRTLAIMADPVFEPTDPRVHSTAGPHRDALPARIPGSDNTPSRAWLSRLAFSREEAAAVARFAPPREVLKATDFNATRAAVLSGTLADYRIVHFATHGVIDTERPALSALALSLVDERGAPVNGYLRLHDIYNLRLDADLIVLSACQTALGKEIKGEGLIGLTRAFMYAGAPRVIASLWEVDDLATAELMAAFYRGLLQRRLRPAAALRAAQLEMAASPRWAAPYYWAGFVLQGDWK